MFCNQCEQTAKGIGCNIAGVCGKNEEVADLQDLLAAVKGGLEDLHLAARHHVKTDPRFALEKDGRPLGVAFADGDLRHLAELFLGQTAEEQALGEQFIFFLHNSK